MLKLLLGQLFELFIGFLERLNNLFVSFFLIHLLLLHSSVFLFSITQLIFKLLDDIEICVSNLLIIVLDIIVLLLMFGCEILDSLILFSLDLENKSLSLTLHLFS